MVLSLPTSGPSIATGNQRNRNPCGSLRASVSEPSDAVNAGMARQTDGRPQLVGWFVGWLSGIHSGTLTIERTGTHYPRS